MLMTFCSVPLYVASTNVCVYFLCIFFFFFNDTATTEIYTLSLHDALPISHGAIACTEGSTCGPRAPRGARDRKSTRLNSSHSQISYAVFCLKKKKIRLPEASSVSAGQSPTSNLGLSPSTNYKAESTTTAAT